MSLRSIVLLSVVFLSTPAMALDPAACSAAAKEIDDRIAAGNHPQQNVAIATQLRDGIMQQCAFLDEATVGQMMQGLDQLLPGGSAASAVPQQSAAEREAEREAQRVEADQRQAEREKRRAAKRAREEAEQELVSEVLRKPPTGRSAKSQFMDRQDTMWGASILDWDVFKGRARLLYMTRPSREQFGLADAARHYYVVEMDRDDNITQQHVVAIPPGRTVTAGLIRGRDEIMLQWHEYGSDSSKPENSNLERWSISGAKMLAHSVAPRMQGPKGPLSPEIHFQLITAAGDLLFATNVALGTGPNPKTGVAWLLSSPAGEVRDQGLIVQDDESVATSNRFHSANASAGLVLEVNGIGENGVDSALQPAVVQFGSLGIRPVVFSEKRLYVVGGAETGASLPAIERRLLWPGLENVDQSLMLSGESTRLMDEAARENRTEDTAVTMSVAGGYRIAVAPSGGGHAVLVRNNLSNTNFPPTAGLWLQDFAPGKPRRDTYFNPDAEFLGSVFNMLASDGGDNLYIASEDHVVLLDGTRRVSAYARSSASDVAVLAMAADGDSVWLFGERHSGSAPREQVWVERIQF